MGTLLFRIWVIALLLGNLLLSYTIYIKPEPTLSTDDVSRKVTETQEMISSLAEDMDHRLSDLSIDVKASR